MIFSEIQRDKMTDLKYSSVQGRRGTTDLTQMPDSEPLYPFARFTESKALFQNTRPA